MSQVFSADSVNLPSPVTVTTNAETAGAVGNFLNPPFGNAKAVVSGFVVLTVGTGTTALLIRIRRNPNAENVAVFTSTGLNVTPGNVVALAIQAADIIPDGRPVQYSVSVQQGGASGNGTIQQSTVSAILISG